MASETKQPPYCPDHPEMRLIVVTRWGFRMALCPECAPKGNSSNIRGYAGQYNWDEQHPVEEVK